MTVILSLATIALLVLLVGRYGADSRTGADPTGRDAAWPAGPVRHHTLRADLRILRGLLRLGAAQVRAHEAFDRSLRPWETAAGPSLTPRW